MRPLSYKKYMPCVLVLAPLLLVLSAFYLHAARGPCWLGTNMDPEYPYLLNALNLAAGEPVGHIDHPGTPLQVLGAAAVTAVHGLLPSEDADVQTDVLRRPEFFLQAILSVLVALNALALLTLGVVFFRATGSIWWSLWLQAAPFFCPVVLEFGVSRITPEPLLLFCSLIFVILIAAISSRPAVVEKKQLLLISLLALATGLGVAAKVTFLPMIIIATMIFSGLKNKIMYLLAAAGSFVFFTLPIIALYPRFFRWVVKVSSHAGRYGSGPEGFPPFGEYVANIGGLLSLNIFFSVVLLAAVLFIAAVCLIPAWRNVCATGLWFKMLIGTAASQVAGILIVAKHLSPHYLLPVLCLSGVMVYLLFYCLQQLIEAGCLKVRLKVFSAGAGICLAILVGIVNPLSEFFQDAAVLRNGKEKSLSLSRMMETTYKEYAKIYFYRCSSREYALKFGSDYSRCINANALEKLYSKQDFYFYDIWKREFSRFACGQTIPFKDIRSKYGDKIVFQGATKDAPRGFTLKNVSNTDNYEEIFVMEQDARQKEEDKSRAPLNN